MNGFQKDMANSAGPTWHVFYRPWVGRKYLQDFPDSNFINRFLSSYNRKWA